MSNKQINKKMLTDKQKNYLLFIQSKILDNLWKNKTTDQNYIMRSRALKIACEDILAKDDYSAVSSIFDAYQDIENGNTAINEFGTKEIIDEDKLLQKIEDLILKGGDKK